jgi:cysteine-rich repeat protein
VVRARSAGWRGFFVAALSAAAVASCNAVLGIEEGEPRPAFCEGKPEGTPLLDQSGGDCVEEVCDGNGKVKVVAVESDVPDDGKPCTLDKCVGSLPVHEMQAQAPCYTGPEGTRDLGICKDGAQVCDAQGNPVGDCIGQVLPLIEVCKTPAIDDDCDGFADESGLDCTCGDGIVSKDTGEECDDGNQADGDPCSPSCRDQQVLQIAGGSHVCALLSGSFVKCWGLNVGGQLGLGDQDNRGWAEVHMGAGLQALDFGTDLEVVAMAASDYNGSGDRSCVVWSDKSIKCWGDNSWGGLGLGDTAARGDSADDMSVALPALELESTATAISVGGYHSCALFAAGVVRCWGRNDRGQLGLGDAVARGSNSGEMGTALPAVDLGQGMTAKAIAAGFGHTCAVLSDGDVKCWGENLGFLGLGDTDNRGDEMNEMGDALPVVSLGTNKRAVAIAAGYQYTCALLSDAVKSQMSVKCWGNNDAGQLGLGDMQARGDAADEMGDVLPDVDLGVGNEPKAVAVGAQHTCALLHDGSIKCWGINEDGRLGLGDAFARGNQAMEMGDALPRVDLGTEQTAKAITVGWANSCALLSEGAVKCWGSNSYGQLGLGDALARGAQQGEMGNALPTVKLFSDSW